MNNLWNRPEVKQRFDELNTLYSDTVKRTKKKYKEYIEDFYYIILNTSNMYEALILLRKSCSSLSSDLYNILNEELDAMYLLDTGSEEYKEEVWCDDGLTIKDRINKVAANLFSNIRTDSYLYKSNNDEELLNNSLKYHIEGSLNALNKIIISELNHTLVLAILDVCKEEGIDEYMYIAELDEKTCDICYLLNELIFKVDEAISGINLPLMHTNCRCTITPVE